MSFSVTTVGDSLLAALPVRMDIVCGTSVVYTTELETKKGVSVSATQKDIVLTVDESWLSFGSLSVVLSSKSIATVTLTDFRVCLVPNTSYSEAQELKFERTGIDIVNKRIVLQADTTEFVGNDGTTRVRILEATAR